MVHAEPRLRDQEAGRGERVADWAFRDLRGPQQQDEGAQRAEHTAAIDEAAMRPGEPVGPELTPWWQEGTTTRDGRHAIGLFVRHVAEISTRAASLDRVAMAASSTDPEVVGVMAHHEALRVAAFRSYVDTLAGRGLLRDEVDAGEATDVLLTLAGSEVFLTFTEGRGWTLARYVAWTTDALCAALLAAG